MVLQKEGFPSILTTTSGRKRRVIYFRNRFRHETPRRRDVWHVLSAVLALTAILTSILVIVPAAPAVAAVAIVETQIASSADDVEERASGSMRQTPIQPR